MKKILPGALLLALCCIATPGYAANANDYFGRWRVTEVADYSGIVAMSGTEMKKKIGLNLVLSENSIKFDHHTCKPHYEISRVETEKYLEEGYRTTNETLKLPNPLVIIDPGADCIGTDIAYIYVAGPDQIVFQYFGVLFRANRVNHSQATKQ